MTKVAIYTRVSTGEQAEKGFSLSEQEARLKSYCDAKGWTYIKTYSDGGYTGANTNRPALQQMMRDISLYDAVLVWRLDRLSRSQKDTLLLIDELTKNDCAFISLMEAFDTSTSIGRAMLGILSTFAQLEREQIAERTRMGVEGRAKAGKWHGGIPPIGYGKGLIPNDEADLVREVFRMFLEGKPYSDIVRDLHLRYPRLNGIHAVQRMLKNPVYTGAITHKGKVYDGNHEAIIDKDTWNRAQTVLTARRTGHKNSAGRYLLTGMVKCGECGMAMVRTNAKGGYTYYVCRSKLKTDVRMKPCGNRRMSERKLDDIVKTEILKLNFETVKLKNPKTDKSKEIKKIEKQISRLIELYQIESIDVADLKRRIDDLEKQKRLLRTPERPVIDTNVCVDIHSKAKQTFDTGDVARSRAIVDALVSKVTICKASIQIHWIFDA